MTDSAAFLGELRHFLATTGEQLPADAVLRMETFLATLEGSDGRSHAQG